MREHDQHSPASAAGDTAPPAGLPPPPVGGTGAPSYALLQAELTAMAQAAAAAVHRLDQAIGAYTTAKRGRGDAPRTRGLLDRVAGEGSATQLLVEVSNTANALRRGVR